jgi:hypothetical protein
LLPEEYYDVFIVAEDILDPSNPNLVAYNLYDEANGCTVSQTLIEFPEIFEYLGFRSNYQLVTMSE